MIKGEGKKEGKCNECPTRRSSSEPDKQGIESLGTDTAPLFIVVELVAKESGITVVSSSLFLYILNGRLIKHKRLWNSTPFI